MAVKLKKGHIGLIAAIFLIAWFAGAFFAGAFTSIGLTPPTSSIFNESGIPQTIQSISAVNQNGGSVVYRSNDPSINSTKFLVNTVIGNTGYGSSQILVNSNLLPSDWKSAGVVFQKSVTLLPTRYEEQIVYPVSTDYTANAKFPIVKYTYTDVGQFNSCPSGTNYQVQKPINPFAGNYGGKLCIAQQRKGSWGRIGGPSYIASLDISVTSAGKKATTQIGTTTSNYPTEHALIASDGTRFGSVKISSEAGLFENLPIQTGYVVPYSQQTVANPTSWGLTSQSSFDNYTAKYQNFDIALDAAVASSTGQGGNTTINFGGIGFTTGCFTTDCTFKVKQIVDAFNSMSEGVLQSNAKLQYNNGDVPTGDMGDKFSFSLVNKNIKAMNVVYELTWDTLGVYTGVGKPSIRTIPSPVIIEYNINQPTQQTNTFGVEVTNVGDAPGTFKFTQTDCQNLVTATATDTGTIDVGKNSVMNVTVVNRAGVTPQEGTCNFEVYNSSFKAQGKYSFKLLRSTDCVPGSGTFRVSNNVIYQCNATGYYEVKSTCQYGVTYVDNNPVCASNPNDKCPAGQEKVNNVCVNFCPEGYTRDTTGNCVKQPDICPVKYHYDAFEKTCVPDEIPKVCPNGQPPQLWETLTTTNALQPIYAIQLPIIGGLFQTGVANVQTVSCGFNFGILIIVIVLVAVFAIFSKGKGKRGRR